MKEPKYPLLTDGQAMVLRGPQIDAAVAAMEGKSIDLDLSEAKNRAAVIRGIRENISFALGDKVTKLCTGDRASQNADFVRARNARLIMSDNIPSAEELGLSFEEEKIPGPSQAQYPGTKMPYCIWHPDFAKEDTYRKLVALCPALKYQVARACAAAGYDALYKELDILPDVSVAEEARESEMEGSDAIYDSVMAQPCRFAVMNDYFLSVNVSSPECPAFLNGDTVVKWMTNHYPYWKGEISHGPGERTRDPIPCITEDHFIKFYPYVEEELIPLLTVEVQLQFGPLPRDLTTVKKTLLIRMAAYHGSIDRYARLARSPLSMGGIEHSCVVRGIYHQSMFAKFWANQLEKKTDLVTRMTPQQLIDVQKAVSARRIIDGDRQVFAGGWDPEQPQPLLIWWPEKPSTFVLWDLYAEVPSMRETVIVAGIMCDYEDVYLGHDFPPTRSIYLAAKTSPNPMYLEKVLQAFKENGIEFKKHDPDEFSERILITQPPQDKQREYPVRDTQPDTMQFPSPQNMYERQRVDPGLAFIYIWNQRGI